MSYKCETVQAFKKLYADRKEIVDYLEKFGNKFEKAQALLIKEIAAMSNDQNTHTGRQNFCGYFGSSSSPIEGENQHEPSLLRYGFI